MSTAERLTKNPTRTIQYKKEADYQITNSWWKEDEDKIYRSAYAVVKNIKQNQMYRELENRRYARLYMNTDLQNFTLPNLSTAYGSKITFNVSKSVVDTACAKISKKRSRPYFLTEKGDFSQQKRAKGLTQFIDGHFYKNKASQIFQQAFRDGCIFGTGAVKVYREEDEIKYERVFINEILVDDLDGRNQTPRSLHQVKLVNKELLYDQFPDKKDLINRSTYTNQANWRVASQMVEIYESWHLPSSSTSTDGRHVIYLNNGTLEANEFTKHRYPFSFFRYSPAILGFYGDGIVSQITGIQLEISLLLQRIKEAQELMAIPRVLVEENSNFASSQVTDEIGSIMRYRTTKPEFFTAQGMGQEVYSWVENLYKKAFELPGVSQLSATSKKPVGLDSSVALREYQDIETERFALVGEGYQELALDVADLVIDLQKDLAKDVKSTKVNVIDGDFVKSIKWKDVDLDKDAYVMKQYPTNLLPTTPEGKLQFSQELIQSGFISPAEGLSLLDFPDLEGFFNLTMASRDNLTWILEQITEEDKYIPPDMMMDLQTGIKMFTSAYLRGETDGRSETAQENLRRWIQDASDLIAQASQAAQPQPQGAQGPQSGSPIAQPQQPPTSDLVPFQTAQGQPQQ